MVAKYQAPIWCEAINSGFSTCLGEKSRIHYHGDRDARDFSMTPAGTGSETMTGGRVRRATLYADDNALPARLR